MKLTKTTPSDREQMVDEYSSGRATAAELAERFGVSRQYVHRVVRAAGVAPRGRRKRVKRKCAHCGKTIEVHYFRSKRTRRMFCSKEHYWAELGKSGYVASRQGQREARAAVRAVFDLLDGDVVHHIDGDQGNNELSNLMVFRDHADHMRWHRGGEAKSGAVPLFRGDGGYPVMERRLVKLPSGVWRPEYTLIKSGPLEHGYIGGLRVPV